MSINENFARMLRRVKQERQLSFSEFADELSIPKSSLENYFNGTGNPRADTLKLLARELNVPLLEIVSDPLPGQEQAETIVRAAREFAGLIPERQKRGFQLFLALTKLFTEKD